MNISHITATMKNKYLVFWSCLQLISVFIITGFLVNGRPELAGDLFLIFIIQSVIFIAVLIFSKRKWFLQ